MNRSVLALGLAAALVLTGGTATVALDLTGDDGDGCGRGGPVAARTVLECVAPSVAFIETALGSGSGILLDGGHIVTNAHVVDPFAAVDVVFGGGERHEAVPVKGVDLVADIAVLGPVDTELPRLRIADFEGGKGDDLFLVGFPGEVDDEPEPAISRGILSRTRTVEDFGLTFFQTDASIGGGQSGGALVDDHAQVVGVSGFSFADEFALALSGEDTRSSIERILGGDVEDYAPFPDGGATSGTIRLPKGGAPQILTLRTGDQPETVRLDLLPADVEPSVLVVGIMGEAYFQNQAYVDMVNSAIDDGGFGFGDESQDADEAVAPGVFEFELPEDTYAVVLVGGPRLGALTLTYTSSVPLGRYDDVDQGRRLRIGDRLEGVLDSLETEGDSFVVELREGDEVEIHASSATGDVGFAIRRADESPDEEMFVDDSDEGLFGVDAKDTFTAERSGEHHITVYSADSRATAYALRVERT